MWTNHYYFGMNMIFWIVIGVIAVSSILGRYMASVSRDRTIQRLAEKGQPIPPELAHGSYYRGSRYGYDPTPARTGIILICIGIAVFVFLYMMTQPGGPINDQMRNVSWLPFAGIFPFMIGVGKLIGAMFDRRKD